MSVRDNIIARIGAECPSIKSAQGIADLSVLLQRRVPLQGAKLPGAFVLRLRDVAGANRLAGPNAVAQQVTSHYGVVLVVRHAGESSGERTSNDIEDLILELDAGLQGYVPAPDHKPLMLDAQAGSIVGLQKDALFYQRQYSTAYRQRTL